MKDAETDDTPTVPDLDDLEEAPKMTTETTNRERGPGMTTTVSFCRAGHTHSSPTAAVACDRRLALVRPPRVLEEAPKMTTQTTTTAYQWRCPCGAKGRVLRDGNAAQAAAEAHVGIDRERSRCRDRRYSSPPLYVRRRDGSWSEL